MNNERKKVAFICVHNSCRSQIAEALGNHLAGEYFECYSAGTEVKTQIFEEVFGYDKESNENTIATHIKNIRAKLANGDIKSFDFHNTFCPCIYFAGKNRY